MGCVFGVDTVEPSTGLYGCGMGDLVEDRKVYLL